MIKDIICAKVMRVGMRKMKNKRMTKTMSKDYEAVIEVNHVRQVMQMSHYSEFQVIFLQVWQNQKHEKHCV